MNGLAGTGAEVAVLPNGTGQDFGRTHGIPAKFDEAVEVALHGRARELDLGRAEFADGDARVFANVGSVGMSGAVARRANSTSKRLGGRTVFYYALVREFAVWKNTQVTVTFDGGERRGKMHDVIVANGRWHGGGMKLAPDARADDGLFDVVLIGDVTKLDFVTTSPKLYSGRHVHHPRVDVLRSAGVAVHADETLPVELDGEVSGTTPVRFEVLPGALRRCAGPERAGASPLAAAFGLLRGGLRLGGRRARAGLARRRAAARRRLGLRLALDRVEALLDGRQASFDRAEAREKLVALVFQLRGALKRRARRLVLRDLPERAFARRLELLKLRLHRLLDHLALSSSCRP